MTAIPLSCVIDTNVPATANGANDGASADCAAASARALQAVMERGHVFIDDGGRIVDEYRSNLDARGEPGPGDVFLKWLLTHEWGGSRVTRVVITPLPGSEEEFEGLPRSADGTAAFDPSDRKFLAVAAAHPRRPPILQSMDSKWWGWREALRAIGVTIHFLCPAEIESKYHEKMEP
jgi:hypothetical protein